MEGQVTIYYGLPVQTDDSFSALTLSGFKVILYLGLTNVCVAVWNSARQQSVKDRESVVALKRAVCWRNPQTTSRLLGLLGLLGQQN